MPASDTDIAAASRDVVTATYANAAIGARYPSARDGSLEPSRGYFDNLADAQAMANARGALIGTERRRFAVIIDQILSIDATAGVPQARVIDSEQALDATMIGARLSVDLEQDRTSLEVFG